MIGGYERTFVTASWKVRSSMGFVVEFEIREEIISSVLLGRVTAKMVLMALLVIVRSWGASGRAELKVHSSSLLLFDAGAGAGAAAGMLPLAALVTGLDGLRIAGVMAVAPLGEPAGPAFDRLAEVAAALRREHPDAWVVSAGMSGDLEQAVAAGATHLRVGTALLGHRAPLLR